MARAGFTQGRLAAVTGATGFVGRRLVYALTAAGWRVRVLVRRSGAGMWVHANTEVVVGDLDDPAALETLAKGAEVVIHAAGLIKARSREAFFEVNVAGARRMAEAVGEGRMVLISSLAARAPELSHYAASKRAGEEAVRKILGERLTVMRPPAIYGPGDRETLALFQVARATPCLPTPGSAAARLALIHVDDVSASVLAHLDGVWTPGVFALGGARPAGYGWRDLPGGGRRRRPHAGPRSLAVRADSGRRRRLRGRRPPARGPGDLHPRQGPRAAARRLVGERGRAATRPALALRRAREGLRGHRGLVSPGRMAGLNGARFPGAWRIPLKNHHARRTNRGSSVKRPPSGCGPRAWLKPMSQTCYGVMGVIHRPRSLEAVWPDATKPSTGVSGQ